MGRGGRGGRGGGGRGRYGRCRQVGLHPCADGIVPAGKKPRVVSVQAFHANAGSGYATKRAGADVASRYGGFTLDRISAVSISHHTGVKFAFGSTDTSGSLEAADCHDLGGADQPVPSGHRCSVMEQRSIAYYDGRTCWGTHHDVGILA